jgi:hypothetical protein
MAESFSGDAKRSDRALCLECQRVPETYDAKDWPSALAFGLCHLPIPSDVGRGLLNAGSSVCKKMVRSMPLP